MRTKKAILNYITDVVPMIILTLIGFVKIDYFIEFLGTDKNGLYNLYSQIMAYVTIVDGGLTSAVLYRMYAPIATQDYQKLGRLLKGSRRIFYVIGALIFSVGIIVSFFLPALVKNNAFEFSYLQGTFFIYLIGGTIPYFCIVSKTVLEGYQEKYISNTVTQSVSIIKGILEILVLLWGADLYTIIVLYTASNLISSVIISIISKKRYSYIPMKTCEPSYEILSDVRDLMIHKIGTLVASNVDMLVISAMKGLLYVTIYSSYYYIIKNLTDILGKISYSMTAGIGDLLQHGKEKAHAFFMEFNAFSFFLSIIVCVPLQIVMNPFVDIWLGGKIETTFLLALAFTLNTFYYIIRMPFRTFVTSAGLFKETRMLPVMETIINLTLSLLLIQWIGVAGVLIATFIAYMCSDYFIRPVIVYNKMFERSSRMFYMKNLFFIVLTIINYIVVALISRPLVNLMDNYINWFLLSCVIFALNFVLTFIEFYFSGNMLFKDRIIGIVRKAVHRNR